MLITDNPFYMLDASPRDSKQVIHDKAETKSFELPEEVCSSAERILLNPKRRLEAEVSWLPGFAPKRVKTIIVHVLDDSNNLNYDSEFFNQLDGISLANALALYLSNIPDIHSSDLDVLKIIICDFCRASSSINLEQTLQLINDDRVSSGFPEIDDIDEIQQIFDEQQVLYKRVLHSFLDKLDSTLSVRCLTSIIEEGTNIGTTACPWPLLDSIITDYETKSFSFFEKQESTIKQDIENIEKELPFSSDLNDFQELLLKLETDVKNWDVVAQPIQVLYKSKGLEHKRSSKLASAIRTLALEAYNKHRFVELSERISNLLSEVFAEVPLIAETIADDIGFLTTTARDERDLLELKSLIKRFDRDSLSQISFSVGDKAIDSICNCITTATSLISKMNNMDIGRNYLASFILSYVIKYVNNTHDYSTGIKLIETVDSLITDKKLHMKLIENKVIIQHNARFKEEKEKGETAKATAVLFFGLSAGFGVLGSIIAAFIDDKSIGIGFAIGAVVGFLIMVYIKMKDSKENADYDARITESLKKLSQAISNLLSIKKGDYVNGKNKLPLQLNEKSHIRTLSGHAEPRQTGKLKVVLFLLFIVAACVGVYFFFNSEYWAWYRTSESTNLVSYRDYLQRFPNGKHRGQAENAIAGIRKRRLSSISLTPFSPEEIQRFRRDFPEYNLSEIDKLFFEDAKHVNDPSYYRDYLDAFPNGEYAMHAKASIKNAEEDMWEKNKNSNDEKELNALLDKIQSVEIRTQIQQHISDLYKDFSFVSQKDTIEAYERFINLCPNSPDCSKAKKRIIDIEVYNIAQGQHGTIPESSPVSYSSGTSATIEIENQTQYSITVRYSGPESIKIEIPSHGSKTITVPIGSYQIAVSTNGGNVHPFYGTNNISAGLYSETFYIQTYPTYRRR